MKINSILNFFDLLAILGINIMLLMAFYFQFSDHELPCALCVMQRMGLYAIAFGLILNLINKRQKRNYFLIIISAVINSFIGLLQVDMHIVPGSGSYGKSIFSLHMYTWSFIISMAFIVYASLSGLIVAEETDSKSTSKVGKMLIRLLFITLLLNIISALFECGPYFCSSDPESYWLIDLFSKK